MGRTRWGLSLLQGSVGDGNQLGSAISLSVLVCVLFGLQSPSKAPAFIKADQTSFSESTPCRATSCKYLLIIQGL